MIDINKIKSRQVYILLTNYVGKNPHILKLQREYLRTRKANLTENQINYINQFHDKEPIRLNKVVKIAELLGTELQKKYNLSFVPEKILIEFMLADAEKTYHIIGKLTTKQDSQMYLLPKSLVMDDPYFVEINIDVDFDKYNETLLEKRGYSLLPFQETGVKFLLGRKGAILADDMGVTKTLQSVVAAIESGAEKVLIICPSSVKINWEREINTFSNQTCIVEGRRWSQCKFTIINYDILKNFHTVGDGKTGPDEPAIELSRELVNSFFDLVIIDEAHNLCNKDSIRGQIVSELCVKYGIPTVWLLSGTPVTNRPMNFYNLLKLIKSPIADNWNHYVKRYCAGRQITKTLKNGRKKKIWLTDGASNLDELQIKAKNVVLRRLKSEVLDLPEKLITNVYNKLSDASIKEYEGLWDAYIEERKRLKKKGTIERELVELGLLKKFIAMESIPSTIELAKEAIEQGEKVLIFATFTDELKELEEAFGNDCVVHHGGMSERDKQFSVDAFQNNPKVKVFIGNVISAGVGITLTAGSTTIFNSYSWVPGINHQCEDRTYRMGQKNTCKIYYQIFLDTISERVMDTLNKKSEVIATIMGKSETRNISELVVDVTLNEE